MTTLSLSSSGESKTRRSSILFALSRQISRPASFRRPLRRIFAECHLRCRYGVKPSQPAPRNGLPKARLNRVIEYIDAHLDQRITLSALAETADSLSNTEVNPAEDEHKCDPRLLEVVEKYLVSAVSNLPQQTLIQGADPTTQGKGRFAKSAILTHRSFRLSSFIFPNTLGNRISTCRPPSGAFRARMLPWWSRTILSAIASPNPTPPVF